MNSFNDDELLETTGPQTACQKEIANVAASELGKQCKAPEGGSIGWSSYLGHVCKLEYSQVLVCDQVDLLSRDQNAYLPLQVEYDSLVWV